MDPVLAAHQVGADLKPRRFELAGLRPSSVRDQMTRALLITQRLLANGTIGPGQLPLLVVGGGAGGVSAAIAAAEHGAHVVLCEKNAHCFGSQANSNRVLDPTEYDWPHPHWQEPRFPWHPPAVPLPYVALPADELAPIWQEAFNDWLANNPAAARLKCRPNMELHTADLQDDPQPDPQHVLASGAAFAKPMKFAAVMSFAGVLREKCRVPEDLAALQPGEAAYEGFPYWSRDAYGKANLGLRGRQPLRVLVSGGGDGALQDFIRVLTGLTARQCARRLGVAQPPQALQLASAEDLGRRAHAWRASGKPVHAAMQRWHQSFEQAAQAQWNRWKKADRHRLAAAVLKRPRVQATLVHTCGHFDHSFALNRYLVLLLARLHAHQRHVEVDQVLLSQRRVVRVAPADDHTCGNPDTCHGLPHHVYTEEARGCRHSAASKAASLLSGEFDCVLIRHGVTPNPLLGRAAISEHLLPHHLPD